MIDQLAEWVMQWSPVESLLWRGTMSMAVAWAVHSVLRQAHPVWRRMAWRVTMVGLIALPVAVLLGWSLPVVRLAARQAPPATPASAMAMPGASQIELSRNSPDMSDPSDMSDKGTRGASPLPRASIIATIWAIGVGLAALRLCVVHVRSRRRQLMLVEPDASLSSLTLAVARDMGIHSLPLLAIDPSSSSPCIRGIGNQTLSVPSELLDSCTPSEVEAIIRHELAHLKSRDLEWSLLSHIASALWWFHPMAWRMGAAHESACEQAADAAAMAGTTTVEEYVQLLARVALRFSDDGSAGLAAPMARRSQIMKRVDKLIQGPLPILPGRMAKVAWTVALLGSFAILSIASAEQEKRLAESETKPVAESAAKSGWDWQAAEYIAPDPHRYFVDDKAGAADLHKLINAVDRDKRDDKEILDALRRGFLGVDARDQHQIYGWLGNRYIWSARGPQNPEAIEAFYHASTIDAYNAVYFGLAVVKVKSPNILQRLAELSLPGEPNMNNRILWGTSSQAEEFRPYLVAQLEGADVDTAAIVNRMLEDIDMKAGGSHFWQWEDNPIGRKHVERARKLGPKDFEILRAGDSATRLTLLREIDGQGLDHSSDEALLALGEALKDPDPVVRALVIRDLGSFIWKSDPDQRAVDMMISLPDQPAGSRALHWHIYFGLSVAPKSEVVLRRLLKYMLINHDNNDYDRGVWGITTYSTPDPALLRRLLEEMLPRVQGTDYLKASLFFLHRDLVGQDPPESWNLASSANRYLEECASVAVQSKADSPTEAELDAAWQEFAVLAPAGFELNRFTMAYPTDEPTALAIMHGRGAAEALKKMASKATTARIGEVYPLPPTQQLLLEERGYRRNK